MLLWQTIFSLDYPSNSFLVETNSYNEKPFAVLEGKLVCIAQSERTLLVLIWRKIK